MKKDNVRNLIVAALATLVMTACGGRNVSSSTSSGTSTTSSGSTSSSSSSSSSSEDPDVKEANRVLAMIEALNEDSTLAEVKAARQAYEELTARQKFIVESKGGLEKLEELEAKIEIKEIGAEISSRIEALDEDDPDEDEVIAIREAYDAFVDKYGGQAELAVAPELVAKLVRCEKKIATKVINVWIAKANALELTKTDDIVTFALLSKDIEAAYEELTPEKRAALEGFEHYRAMKDTLGDYATPFGAQYQAVDAGFEEFEEVEDVDFGHHSEFDYSDVDLKGEGNLQFYIPPAGELESYDRIGFYASMPIECDLTFFNNGEVVSQLGHFAANEWKFVTVDVNKMPKPSDYSVVGAWFADRSVAKLPGFKLTQLVGLKKTYPANATIFSSVWLNSEISPGWEKYGDIEEDPERGPLTIVDFTGGATHDTFQVCWNEIPLYAAGTYSGVYQDIYNPTGSTIENIVFKAISGDWVTAYETTTFSLEPGWNKVSIPTSMFTHEGAAMLTATATSAWAAPQWKFGRIYAVRPSGTEVDFGGLAINSNYKGYVAFPTAQDVEHGEVVVLDLSELDIRADIIWNNVPHKASGQFGLVYFWMYNPTSSSVDLTVRSQDKDWNQIDANPTVALEPGWNKVFVKSEMFCQENLNIMLFSIAEDEIPQWKADGWKIGHFIGIEN